MVADGTPAALTRALTGRTLGVRAAEPRKAQAALHAAPGVLSVAQIGNELRVLVEPGGDVAQLQARLRASAIDAEVSAIEPNLEDVFVSATQRASTTDKDAVRAA